MSRSQKVLVAGLVFLASLATTIGSGRLEGDFRIDEVHKISETFFLRLVEQGDFRSSAWLDSPVERTNPPVGKLLFGLAIQAAGQPLPTDLRVATLTQTGRRLPPPESQAQYQRWLLPTRMVSALATAATASLICLLGWFATDLSGGLICVLFFSLNFLVAAFSATAVFDPLLSFLIVLAGALSLLVENQTKAALFASLAAALAFNVRVTGLLAIGGCLLIFLITRRLRAAALSAMIFPVAAIALNPYYWVPGPANDFLAVRIASRLAAQQRDLRMLLNRELAAQGALDSTAKKVSFLFQYALGDWIGITILLGILCLIAALIVARRRSPQAVAVCVWSTAIALVVTLWIPIAFPRYLLVAVPPLALLGGLGWRFAAMGIAEVTTNVSTSPRPNPNGR